MPFVGLAVPASPEIDWLLGEVLDLDCLLPEALGESSIATVSSESSMSAFREFSAASFFFFDFSFSRRATSLGRGLYDLNWRRQFLHLRQHDDSMRELMEALELYGDS